MAQRCRDLRKREGNYTPRDRYPGQEEENPQKTLNDFEEDKEDD